MLLVRTRIGPSPIDGIGLFAAAPIAKGTRIWRFSPGFDLDLDRAALNALDEIARETLLHYGYIDARTGRYLLCCDDARFINHSDRPNIASDYDIEPHGVDFALRGIRTGEELTVDYRMLEDGERFTGAPGD